MEKMEVEALNIKMVAQLKSELGHVDDPKKLIDYELLARITAFVAPMMKDRDDSLVACTDPEEREFVKRDFLLGKLGVLPCPMVDAAIEAVCRQMRKMHFKPRPLFYYLLLRYLDAYEHKGIIEAFRSLKTSH